MDNQKGHTENCTRKSYQRGKEIVTENQQHTQQEVTPTSRPYSLMGLCVYLGASTNWWNEFRSACINKGDKDFLEVIARVEETIKTQQFEGACVGAFNANIIARTLGAGRQAGGGPYDAGKAIQGIRFSSLYSGSGQTEMIWDRRSI